MNISLRLSENSGKSIHMRTSVFVMMKFPDGLAKDQAKLVDRIFEVIGSALGAYDLVARRADKQLYEPDLWNNLCVYMLGCRFGLAGLEAHGAKRNESQRGSGIWIHEGPQ